MEAYLAAEAELESKRGAGLGLVSAMELSVNEIISKDTDYRDGTSAATTPSTSTGMYSYYNTVMSYIHVG